MIKKTITVMDMTQVNNSRDSAYKVVKLQNSIAYLIGSYLSETEAYELCEDGDWTMNVIPYKK